VAVDYFLSIDGVAGESLDDKHKGAIDVLSWSWGEANSGSIVAGGGAGAGKVAFNDFSFTMNVSKATPALFQACANGQHFKEARLTGRQAGRAQADYLTWTFSDVLVSSYQTGGSQGDDRPVENVGLTFTKAQLSYAPQKPDGTLDTPLKAGWDLRLNTKA
jgi:type VI secretion system secreted protein Hcp